MVRYFLEVAYRGTNYSGFQVQKNANSIQEEIEKAISVLQKQRIILTGSSRTDAGVHALQNFFHFDFAGDFAPDFRYKINSILPDDIVVKKLNKASPQNHCRFDATSREYRYFIYRDKDPFLKDRAFYFPYKLKVDLMQQAAGAIQEFTDFTSFSKRNTQVKTFNCRIMESKWEWEDNCLVFSVKADRFLRGMVRALTATMLKVGREKITLDDFRRIVSERDSTAASFAVPAHGLFLVRVNFPDGYFQQV